MRIRKTIDPAPFPFGAPPPHPELDRQYQRGEEADTGKLEDRPLFPKGVAAEPDGEQAQHPEPRVPRVREEDGNSAQCAWLFRHAHLSGETYIEFEYGIQIYFPALRFVLVATAEAFFVPLDPFLTALTAGLDLTSFLAGFFTMLFAFNANLRCCFARSARSSSS